MCVCVCVCVCGCVWKGGHAHPQHTVSTVGTIGLYSTLIQCTWAYPSAATSPCPSPAYCKYCEYYRALRYSDTMHMGVPLAQRPVHAHLQRVFEVFAARGDHTLRCNATHARGHSRLHPSNTAQRRATAQHNTTQHGATQLCAAPAGGVRDVGTHACTSLLRW